MSRSAPTPGRGGGGFLAQEVADPLDPLAHEALTALLRHGTDLLALVGADARIRYLSPAVESLLGQPPRCYIGRPILELVHPDDLAGMTWHLSEMLAHGGTSEPLHCRVVRADGTTRAVELVASDVSDVPGLDGAFVVNSRDVTDQRLHQDELAYARTHDRVTGLAGERELLEALDQHLASDAANVTVLACGIDDLRQLTGGAGRDTQDDVLRVLGRRAGQHADDLGRTPQAVARVGNSTFLVLCADSDEPQAVQDMAEDARRALSTSLDLDGQILHPSASVGAVAVRRRGEARATPPAESVVDEALLGLREARRRGGGVSVVVDQQLTERAHRSEAMARDLRVAVEAGGLRVHYQPKVALDADRITGFEALARWQHPTWGPVPPPVFIEIAEEHGIIDDLGRWILGRAVEDAATWASPGTEVAPSVAVNISARQFSPELPAVVAATLARAGLAPERLTLEVTESTVMDDPTVASAVLAALKAIGVRLSIDDFGTGYSSLAQLRRFPLDELKIDKSFVDGLGTEAEDTAIVAAIMAMAHALDLAVVAEGIEDEQQRAELRRLGAEQGQGYLFSRPLPAEETRALAAQPDAPRATGEVHPIAVAPSGADVVVADDAPEVLQLLAVSLAAAGFTTHQASDGTEALAALRAVRPVAAVLDVEMPGLRGPEVCRQLRADPDLADCTVIILSAHSSAEDRIEAFRAGADEYVVKPFSPRDIVSRTTAALERRRRAEAARP